MTKTTNKSKRRRGRRKVNPAPVQGKPIQVAEPTVYEQVARNFVACHRCDHFLSGYRAHVGKKTLHEQIDAQHHNWLTLSLDENVKQRVAGAYGVDISADVVHCEGRCPVCGRLFVLEIDGENLLYMQVAPHLVKLNH